MHKGDDLEVKEIVVCPKCAHEFPRPVRPQPPHITTSVPTISTQEILAWWKMEGNKRKSICIVKLSDGRRLRFKKSEFRKLVINELGAAALEGL